MQNYCVFYLEMNIYRYNLKFWQLHCNGPFLYMAVVEWFKVKFHSKYTTNPTLNLKPKFETTKSMLCIVSGNLDVEK